MIDGYQFLNYYFYSEMEKKKEIPTVRKRRINSIGHIIREAVHIINASRK